MLSKQASNEITDLNGGKCRQELQREYERTTATPHADGKNNCGCNYEQRESDWAKTESKNQTGRSSNNRND